MRIIGANDVHHCTRFEIASSDIFSIALLEGRKTKCLINRGSFQTLNLHNHGKMHIEKGKLMAK